MPENRQVVGRIGEDQVWLFAGKERGVAFWVTGIAAKEEMLTQPPDIPWLSNCRLVPVRLNDRIFATLLFPKAAVMLLNEEIDFGDLEAGQVDLETDSRVACCRLLDNDLIRQSAGELLKDRAQMDFRHLERSRDVMQLLTLFAGYSLVRDQHKIG